jgi:hypothetical protein
MRPAFWIGWLGIPLFAACASLGATDTATDPDASSQPGTTVGTVGTTCSAEINKCGWLALECSSDPACAHWYACVLDCHPSHGLQGCFDDCSAAQAPSATGSELQKCLLGAHNGTCSPPAVGTDAEADSEVPDPKVNDDAGQNPYATCDTCVWGNCEAQINACTTPAETPPDCLDYKHILLGCAASDGQLGFEKCLLDADKEAAAAHDDFASHGAMACALFNCADLCLPPDYRSCAACSSKDCADAWNAYLHDGMAQDLAWCRDGCHGAAECINGCKTSYGDGAGVLSALVACQSQACPSCI